MSTHDEVPQENSQPQSGEKMKTRSELIYDFMLALSSNMDMTANRDSYENSAVVILQQAQALADAYLEIV